MALITSQVCLCAPACMAIGAGVIKDWESGLVGVSWGNAFTATGNISFATSLFMLIFDFVLYGAFSHWRLSFCWHPLSIPIETSTSGRGGVQQNDSLADG